MYLLKHEKFRRVRLALCFALTICFVVGLTPASAMLSGNSASGAVVFAADDDPTPWTGDYDYGFYTNAGGAAGTKYYISTPEELAGFSAIVAGLGKDRKGNPIPADDFKGSTVSLTADLDMGGVYDETNDVWGGPTWVDLGATAETQSYPLGGTGTANRLTSITATTAGEAIRYTNGRWDGPQWWPIGTYPQTIPVVAGEAMISAGITIASDPTITAMPTTAAIGRIENLLFQGTFNGQYHAISNIVSLYPDDADLRDPGDNIEFHNTGLFGNVGASGVIKNVIIDSGEFDADSYTGTIAGRCAGRIENCASYAFADAGYNNAAGGIVGVINGNGASVKNCFFGGDVLFEYNSNSGAVGGIVGQNSGNTIGFTIENCYSYGGLGTNSTNVARLPGLILGRAQGTNMAKIVNSYAVDDPVTYDASSTTPLTTTGALVGFNSLTNASIDADSCTKTAIDMSTQAFVDTLNGTTKTFTKDIYGDNDGFPMFREAWLLENTFSIDYDEGDGVMPRGAELEKSVINGEEYGVLPTPTPEDGYHFTGWHLNDESGPLIEAATIVDLDDDATLYATYKAYCYVDFDEGEGDMPRYAIEGFWAIPGKTCGELADGNLPIPSRPGYRFTGWHLNSTKGEVVNSATVLSLSADSTLYATYTTIPTKVESGADKDDKTVSVDWSSKYGTVLPNEPDIPGYVFVGWFTQPGAGGDEVDASVLASLEGDFTLYGYYVAGDVTVNFKKNGKGVKLETLSKDCLYLDNYPSLPVPSRTGYTFDGWYTKAKGGTEVDEDTICKNPKEHNLYAHWKANKYKVKFHVNGGKKLKKASKKFTFDKKFGKLPKAKRTGYKFLGWYTGSKYGTKVTKKSKVTEKTIFTTRTTVFYAHWKKK